MRVTHRNIATNIMLERMDVSLNKCSFCHIETETIQHLFWKCHVVKRFWQAFEQFLNEKCETMWNMKMNEETVLLRHSDQVKSDDVFDFLVLFAKFFIYTCKLFHTVHFFGVFLK